MSAKGRPDRLTAALTGRGRREMSATEARRLNIMITARKVAKLEREQRKLRARLKVLAIELRYARREFKLYTQEPEMATLEGFTQ